MFEINRWRKGERESVCVCLRLIEGGRLRDESVFEINRGRNREKERGESVCLRKVEGGRV